MPKISEVIGKMAEQKGYNVPVTTSEQKIAEYISWYKGFVDKFHTFKAAVNGKLQKFTRSSLQSAKMVAEDWASILWAENVMMDYVVDGKETNETDIKVKAILEENNFDVMFGQAIELAFGQSEHMTVEFMEDGKTIINFVSVNDYIVLEQWNGRVTAVASWTERIIKGTKFMLISFHRKVGKDYMIENSYHKITRKGGYIESMVVPMSEIDADLKEVKIYNDTEPFFQIVKPNIVNNQDPTNSRGIPTFANSIDTIKMLDMIETSYSWDFESGENKVLITSEVLDKSFDEETGAYENNFDARTRTYMLANGISESPVNVIQFLIRAEDHDRGLIMHYAILGKKNGLGKEYYNYKDGKVYKNKDEIFTSTSDLWVNKLKHEKILAHVLRGIWSSIIKLNGFEDKGKLVLTFDDSLINDSNTQKAADKLDVMDGVMTKEEYVLKWNKKVNTQEDAIAYVAKLAREGFTTDPELLGIK